ncbi:MAG: PAS domain-containing sensor histidine kinase [Desulfobacterales bacterium]
MSTTSDTFSAKTRTDAAHLSGRGRQMKNRATLADLLEHIEDGYFEVDLSGSFEIFNEAMREMVGYAHDELAGMNYKEYIDSEDAGKVFELFNRVFRTGVPSKAFDWKIIRKDGAVRHIETSVSLRRDAHGKPVGFLGVARDVTQSKLRELALRTSEARYRSFLESSPDPIVIYDLEGFTKYVNPSFERTFGWVQGELFGKRIDFVPEQQRRETKWAIEQLMAEKSVKLFETQRLTKDGRVLDVQLSSAVYPDPEGRPAGVIVILRDISGIKRAQNALTESERKFSILIQEAPYGISIIDHSGTYRYLNRKFTEIFDYTLEDIPDGRAWFNRAFPDSETRRRAVGVWKTEHATWVPGETKPYVRKVTCKSGEKKIICFRPVIMPSREYFVSYEDISEREIAKKKLVQAHQELRQAHQRLISMEQLREKAVHHLSHELSTPVAVLDAILKILGNKATARGTENYSKLIERGQRCLQRLKAIQVQMDDVSVLSRKGEKDRFSNLLEEFRWISRQGVETATHTDRLLELLVEKAAPVCAGSGGRKEKLGLRQLIQEELDKAQEFSSFRVLRILNKADAGLAVHMDRTIAGKVLGGLIKNAIENTPDGGLIVIKARGNERETVVEVMDFGVGITTQNQQALFKGFFHTQDTRYYSTKRGYEFNAGGSGSDLLRMRLFAEQLGFSISFKSRRCCYIPTDEYACPGCIANCRFVRSGKECMKSGGSKFTLVFPKDEHVVET